MKCVGTGKPSTNMDSERKENENILERREGILKMSQLC
jgi:hypothetical protein